MKHYEPPLEDTQQKPHIATCPVCRMEVYRYDEVAQIGGKFVHQSCMTLEELEDYSTYPAISFFEEAC